MDSVNAWLGKNYGDIYFEVEYKEASKEQY